MQSNNTFLKNMIQPYAEPFSWRVQDFRCVSLYNDCILALRCAMKNISMK